MNKNPNSKSNGPVKSFKAILQSNRKRPAYSITPIGIFAALLQFRTAAGHINPIKAYRHEIIKTAEISGPVTYHRCTGDLNDYGYINYLPKRNRIRRASFISPFKSLLKFSVKDSKAVFMRNLGSLSHEQIFFCHKKFRCFLKIFHHFKFCGRIVVHWYIEKHKHNKTNA